MEGKSVCKHEGEHEAWDVDDPMVVGRKAARYMGMFIMAVDYPVVVEPESGKA